MKIEKLHAECMDNLWGGTKLKERYNKVTNKDPCAESWELSFHPHGATRISDGRKLMDVVTEENKGKNVNDFSFFPTLIKFIDAKNDLSVQVHPSDSYALKYENSYGKTEMWYVVEAEQGAGIYVGFNRDVTKSQYEEAIKNNTITQLLNFYEVKKGDCFFIPSGTIHAIGKGCLICEIQQNSDLTYRVYDYGRRDKKGNLRELHIEKALEVTRFVKYEKKELQDSLLGISKYFTVHKYDVSGKMNFCTDGSTFNCITCVSGNGYIDNEKVCQGDSFFVPADYGCYLLSGNMTVIETEIRKYYIGIDLGGTFIKGGIVDDLGNIVMKKSLPTESERGQDAVAHNIVRMIRLIMDSANLTESDIENIGIGIPGMIDSQQGKVIYSNNLNWKNFYISEVVEKEIGKKVKIANDANVAALGESKFGSGKNYKNMVFITLGTGVGSGIIIDGRLYGGNLSAGAEIGHTVIDCGGEECTCGRKGCLEAYASASALIRDTKKEMQAHKESKMWKAGALDKVTGRTAFDFMNEDEIARQVVDNYIEKLGVGLVNVANVLRPEAIVIGGGVSAQGDNLIKPLQKYVDNNLFGKDLGPGVKILKATLGNDAGLLGASAL